MRDEVLNNDVILFELLLSKKYDDTDFEIRLWKHIKKYINSDHLLTEVKDDEEICLALAEAYNAVL